MWTLTRQSVLNKLIEPYVCGCHGSLLWRARLCMCAAQRMICARVTSKNDLCTSHITSNSFWMVVALFQYLPENLPKTNNTQPPLWGPPLLLTVKDACAVNCTIVEQMELYHGRHSSVLGPCYCQYPPPLNPVHLVRGSKRYFWHHHRVETRKVVS